MSSNVHNSPSVFRRLVLSLVGKRAEEIADLDRLIRRILPNREWELIYVLLKDNSIEGAIKKLYSHRRALGSATYRSCEKDVRSFARITGVHGGWSSEAPRPRRR